MVLVLADVLCMKINNCKRSDSIRPPTTKLGVQNPMIGTIITLFRLTTFFIGRWTGETDLPHQKQQSLQKM